MGPEKTLQTACSAYLRSKGWLVLRVGNNGLPDIVAVKPEGKGLGWDSGPKDTNCPYYIKWQGATSANTRILPKGLALFPGRKDTKLFIEFKIPGGVRSPRQKSILILLSRYGQSAFIESEYELIGLLNGAKQV